MHSFFTCNSFLATKGYAAAPLPLMETVLLRFAGLGTDINIICSVVSSSFRPLVVSLARSLKRFCGIASWRGAAIGALATNLRREREEPSTTGVAISATSHFNTLISFTEPAFFALLPLHLHGGTQCVSVHPRHCGMRGVVAWHRQEQKLIFTSLPWHVSVGPCASRTSLAGGCCPPFDHR